VFAFVAAVIFAIVFILDLVGQNYGPFINAGTLTALGLFFLALHFAPLGRVRRR
jgi:hypothetical protein